MDLQILSGVEQYSGRMLAAAVALFLAIFFAVLAWYARQHRRTTEPVSRAARCWQLFVFIVLLPLVSVPIVGIPVLALHGRSEREENMTTLRSVAYLNARQIESWLGERRGDGDVLMRSTGFAADVARVVAAHDPQAIAQVTARFEDLIRVYPYDAIALVGLDGRPLVEVGGRHVSPPAVLARVAPLLATPQVEVAPFVYDSAGNAHLDMVVPLVAPTPDHTPLATVILHLAAQRTLLPAIRGWPTKSESGETLVARQEGDEVVFLTDLRFRQGVNGPTRLRIDTPDLPAARALQARRPDTMTGVDYRGARVFAAYRPVEGTDWVLVAKVDEVEAMRGSRQMALWVSLTAALSLMGVGAAVLLYLRQVRRAHRAALHAQEERSLQRFFHLPFVGMAVISPVTRKWLQFNEELLQILGYTRAELLALRWDDVTHPDDLQMGMDKLAAVLRAESEGFVYEKRFVRKDGAVVHAMVDVKCVRKASGDIEVMLATIQDITERKLAETKVKRIAALYAALSKTNEAIVRCTSEAELFRAVCSAAVEFGGAKLAFVGLVREDTGRVEPVAHAGLGAEYLEGLEISILSESEHGQGPTGTALRENRPYWCEDFLTDPATTRWRARGAPFGWRGSAALPLHCRGKTVGALTIYTGEAQAFDDRTRELLLEMAGDISFALDTFADQADRRHAEQVAQGLAEQLQFYLKSSPVVSYSLALDNGVPRPLWVSANIRELLGYSEAETMVPDWWLRHMHPDDRDAAKLAPRLMHHDGDTYRHEYRFHHRDGRLLWIFDTMRLVHDASGGTRVAGAWMDITAQKELHASLAASEERFRVFFDQAPLGVALLDGTQGRIRDVNPMFAQITGRNAQDLLQTAWQDIAHPDDRGAVLERLSGGVVGSFAVKLRYLRPDGVVVWTKMTVTPMEVPAGEMPQQLCMVEDITESERMIQALRESESKFRVLAEQSIVGIYTLDQGRVTYANPRAAAIYGYTPDEVIGQPFSLFATEQDWPLVQQSMDMRLRGDVTSVAYELAGRKKDGSNVMVAIHGGIMEMGGHQILMGVMLDATEKHRSDLAIHDYIDRIERMIQGTVDAMSLMVELRDPYTAGHERRVGEVAAAIAAEMGLDEDRQRGLRLAGAVHDVGKMAVPTEILVKPSRLTALEYELIKGHAEQGFQVLQGIDSPWPIAEIARQHHERMDGTGYPRGLRGDEILLEARIVAVADVMESMASHRPYRPTRGIDAALDEIAANAGRLYDPDVAAACLRLFREKGYVLPT